MWRVFNHTFKICHAWKSFKPYYDHSIVPEQFFGGIWLSLSLTNCLSRRKMVHVLKFLPTLLVTITWGRWLFPSLYVLRLFLLWSGVVQRENPFHLNCHRNIKKTQRKAIYLKILIYTTSSCWKDIFIRNIYSFFGFFRVYLKLPNESDAVFLDVNKIVTWISSSSSSCRVGSTDIPDPLSPLFPIVHRLWQVFWATLHILT